MEGLPGHPVPRPRRRARCRADRAERVLTVPSPRRVVLLRHGRTAHNAGGVMQGQLDVELDDLGRAQAEAAAAVLAGLRPDVLVASDLRRAADTAAALAAGTGLPLALDPRLRELDLGAWQGLTLQEAAERFPGEYAAWRAGRDETRGGGETYAAAGARAAACVTERLADVPPGGTLVAVSHGGTARAALGVLLELDPASWARLAPLGNACWSVVVEGAMGWRLERHGVEAPVVATGEQAVAADR